MLVRWCITATVSALAFLLSRLVYRSLRNMCARPCARHRQQIKAVLYYPWLSILIFSSVKSPRGAKGKITSSFQFSYFHFNADPNGDVVPHPQKLLYRGGLGGSLVITDSLRLNKRRRDSYLQRHSGPFSLSGDFNSEVLVVLSNYIFLLLPL